FNHLLNYCADKVNNNELEYAITYLKLIDKLNNENLMLEQGIFDPIFFKNCITMSILAKEVGKAEAFINTWSRYLKANIREDIVQITRAIIEFERGNWKKSEKILENYIPYDYYYKVLHDKISLKILYVHVKSKNFKKENFIGKIHSAKKYISTKKELTKEKKRKLLAFPNVLLNLCQGRTVELHEYKRILSPSDYTWFQKQISEES
ncbi:MAG: hypothetical protein AAGG68_15965, partial [Bacteroidota bacterium]